jgi:hypothetical protein
MIVKPIMRCYRRCEPLMNQGELRIGKAKERVDAVHKAFPRIVGLTHRRSASVVSSSSQTNGPQLPSE